MTLNGFYLSTVIGMKYTHLVVMRYGEKVAEMLISQLNVTKKVTVFNRTEMSALKDMLNSIDKKRKSIYDNLHATDEGRDADYVIDMCKMLCQLNEIECKFNETKHSSATLNMARQCCNTVYVAVVISGSCIFKDTVSRHSEDMHITPLVFACEDNADIEGCVFSQGRKAFCGSPCGVMYFAVEDAFDGDMSVSDLFNLFTIRADIKKRLE